MPYPSIVDVHDVVWRAYHSNTWPDTFLIDRKGNISEVHQGEGNYGAFEREIQRLLQQGHRDLDFSKFAIQPDGPLAGPTCGQESQEIYVGYERGALWGGQLANHQGFQPRKVSDYAPTSKRVKRGFFVVGEWRNNADDFESVSGSRPEKEVSLGITYQGRDVYAVFNRSAKGPVELAVTRDGHPIPASLRGKDIRVNPQAETFITIDEPRMYYVITQEDSGTHELHLLPKSGGVRVCSFTFGNRCLDKFDRL